MILAAHQPHYLPWLRYVAKMVLADVFVLLDDVQYTKNGWQNRNRIKTAKGWTYLTVPVHAHVTDRILDVRVAEDRWRDQHRRSLKFAYARAAHFASHMPFFEDFYAVGWQRLVDLNVSILQYLRSALGLHTSLVLASSLGAPGQGSERLVRICRALGAAVYLSGAYAATNHLDAAAFRGSGVELVVMDWTCPTYRQCHSRVGFLPDLSVVDLLFNEGEAAADILRSGVRISEPVRGGGMT